MMVTFQAMIKMVVSSLILSSELFGWAEAARSEAHHGLSKAAGHKKQAGNRHRKHKHIERACRPDTFDPEDSNATIANTKKHPKGLFLNDTDDSQRSTELSATPLANDTNTPGLYSQSEYQNSTTSTVSTSTSDSETVNSSQSESDGTILNWKNTTQAASNTFSTSNSTVVVSNSTQTAIPTSSLLTVFPSTAMKQGDLFLGFLPDDGASGGTRQTMAQLNAAVGAKSAVYGWYGQAHSGTLFDGSQLLNVIDDVQACNCVFQPAVMPVDGWQGLTAQDNSQAVAIANVMKKFTDKGIPVWLRFAHEVNYYQTDGTYQGTAADFKAGWAAVSAAVKQIAPDVKMWWTPNVDSAENYAAYEPDDMNTVDLVGIDFYPKRLTGNDFLSVMKDFHDKYAVDGRKFAIGETGLGWAGGLEDKYKWLHEICVARTSLPQFVSAAWFNFDKDYDYKIAGEPTLNQKFTSFIATS